MVKGNTKTRSSSINEVANSKSNPKNNEDSNAKDKKSGAASAKPFKRVVDKLTDRFHGFQQRDAHEFLGEVIDQIHEELSPPKAEEPSCTAVPTDEFFRWNVQVCLKCNHCGYSR